MLDPSLTHIGSAKLLGTTLLPASLFVLVGVLAWQIWLSKKNLNQLEQQLKTQQQEFAQQLNQLKQPTFKQTFSAKSEYSNATNPSKLAMLRRLVEDNLTLRQEFTQEN
jgi:hypothetical protein